jgi:hypothetical protein
MALKLKSVSGFSTDPKSFLWMLLAGEILSKKDESGPLARIKTNRSSLLSAMVKRR